MKITELDKNLEVAPVTADGGISFFDVRKPPFRLYGLHKPESTVPFLRMPEEVAIATSPGVHHLAYQTAGGRLRFSTDSTVIVFRAELNRVSSFAHMPTSGFAGFDLFLDLADGSSRHVKSLIPPYGIKEGFSSEVRFRKKRLRHFTLNFPSYSGVTHLSVGVGAGAALGGGLPYRVTRPAVFYGSSITQGACASRPGIAYPNIVSRRLSMDFQNLGFSGNGKGEEAICRYIAGIPMSVFICDYDHNAPSADDLRETHKRLYDILRASQPDLPYIMLSRPDFDAGYDDSVARRDAVYATYRAARAAGDRNVYFIDGASLFRGRFEGICTVDMTHPNDLGMALIADAVEAEIRRAFTQGEL